MKNSNPIRILVGKAGLDGHDRGAKVIARGLRDAGFEVIYSGLHQTPSELVEMVVQEDAQVLGLSILSGAHLSLVPAVISGLKAAGLEGQVLLLVGGIIPDSDIEPLKAMGVSMVFTPGTTLESVVSYIRSHAPSRME
jgi:methylmalonyl-CoA mutase C-terminal domain/subunit